MAVVRSITVFRTWRNDATAAGNAQDYLKSNNPRNLLSGKDTFFGGPGLAPYYDWPNPPMEPLGTKRKYGGRFMPAITAQANMRQQPLNVLLLSGTDTFFAGPGRGPEYDWPNPRGAAPGISLRTWTDPLKLNLLAKDKFFGLAGSPRFDWPNPRGAAFPSDLRGSVNQVEINLLAQDQFFGLAGHPNYDWPVPKAPAFPSDLRGYLAPLDPVLLGKDSFFGLAGTPKFDWPNPRGAAYPNDLRGFLLSLQGTTLTPQAFAEYDWPNPRGALFANDLRGFTLNLMETTLASTEPAPFAEYDWPNPQGYVFSGDSRFWTLTTNPNLYPQPEPIIIVPPPAPPPPETTSDLGGSFDNRRRDDQLTHRVDYAERDRIAAEMRALYREVYDKAEPDSEAANDAAALVADFAPTNAPDFPPPNVVDWAALAEEGRTVVARFRAELMRLDRLIAAKQAAMAAAEDEDAIIALLLTM